MFLQQRSLIVLVLLLALVFSSSFIQATTNSNTTIDEHYSKWPKFLIVTSKTASSTYRVLNVSAGDKLDSSTDDLRAVAHYKDSFFTSGWHLFDVESFNVSSSSTLADEYRAAGFAEGFLTYNVIMKGAPWKIAGKGFSFFKDYVLGVIAKSITGKDYGPQMSEQISKNIAFVRGLVKNVDSSSEDYLKRLAGLLAQLEGLRDGFNARVKALGKTSEIDELTFIDVFSVNLFQEIWDILSSVQAQDSTQEELQKQQEQQELGMKPRRPLHCSALARVTNDEVFLSHTSWTSLKWMSRLMKSYRFSDQSGASFSSWPMFVHSMGDFYASVKGLSVIETSLVVYHQSYYKDFPVPINSVPEFMRIALAVHGSDLGSEFSTTFSRYNSQTYNNEWLVVDNKVFKKNQITNQSAGLLWIVDQCWNKIFSGDVTSTLNTRGGFIGSWNNAFFPEAREYLGSTETYTGQAFWNYSSYARSRIFTREAPKVTDLAGMQRIMRWNQYKTDDASLIQNCTSCDDGGKKKCNPEYSSMLAIASRGDLMPKTGSMLNGKKVCFGPEVGFLGQRDHAAIDAKISSSRDYDSSSKSWSKTTVINGPSNQDVPTFKYSTSPVEINLRQWAIDHEMPDIWDFPWLAVSNSRNPNNNNNGKVGVTDKVVGYSFAVLLIVCLVAILWVLFTQGREGSEKEKEKKLLADGGSMATHKAPGETTAANINVSSSSYGAVHET